MTKNQGSILCVLVIVPVLAWAAPAGAAWVVTEISTPSGWTGDTVLYDINDSGVACGVGNYVSEVSSVAFRYDGTIVTELPYLHPAPVNYPFAWASAINSNGLIAGRSHGAEGVDRAVIWDEETVIEIPFPEDANTNNDMRAYGLNDAGVVVGYYSSTTTGYPAAFYYDGTTHSLVSALQAVGLDGGQSYADDVNNNGVICGEAKDTSGEYNFFIYNISTSTATNLGRVYASEGCHAASLNDAGHVVGRGRSYFNTPIHALLHDGAAFNIIDPSVAVSQWATDINNDGRVVGNADTSSNRWAWYSDATTNGSMIRTELPGWERESFQGINIHDVMVGYGRTAASPDDARAFIVAPPPGDFDHNGAIDLGDYAEFVACISGPKEGGGFTPPSQACLEAFDLAPSSENYTVKEIPMLSTWTGGAEATDINSSGVVCGSGNYVINTSSTPFRYDGSTINPLPILPDADVPIAIARAINADGVICGDSHNADGYGRAVYWEGTTLTTLPCPADMRDDRDFRAYDINDNDVMVGYYYSTNGAVTVRTAFYYDGSTHSLDSAIRAGGLYDMQIASGINNNGIISGTADDEWGIRTAWTYDFMNTNAVTVIGRSGAGNCSAVDINESGQTIGRSDENNDNHYQAVTYDGAWHLVDPTVSSSQWGEAINDKGRMVGHASVLSSKWSWYSDGPGDDSMIPLNLPGWTREAAQSINNDDVIVGYGRTATSGSDNRAFIYTPVPGDGDIDLEDFAAFQEAFEGN